jgi:hypothetical protein
MSDFDALLKRSFAEAHEPVDDGFSVAVSRAVAGSERGAKIRALAQSGALAVAAAAIIYALYGVLQPMAPQVLDQAGLQLARAHGVLTAAPSATGMFKLFGSGLTQLFLVAGALAAGAAVYRQTQEDA